MMYQKLTFEDYELIKEVEKETMTDYELFGDFISQDSFICIIRDLMTELHNKKEEIEDLEEYRRQYCNLYDKYL